MKKTMAIRRYRALPWIYLKNRNNFIFYPGLSSHTHTPYVSSCTEHHNRNERIHALRCLRKESALYELEESTLAHLYAFSRALNDLSSSLSRRRDNRGGQGREQGHDDGSAAAVGAKSRAKMVVWVWGGGCFFCAQFP
jgi:hypothetical protein